MLRVIVVGDSRDRPGAGDVRRELVRGLAHHELEVLDLSLRGTNYRDMCRSTAWEETAVLVAAAGKSPHRELIVGWDPLHAAVAARVRAGVPWVLHLDSDPTAVIPNFSLHRATALPGLFEVLGAMLRGASLIFVRDAYAAVQLRDVWSVAEDRLVLTGEIAIEASTRGPHDSTRQFRPAGTYVASIKAMIDLYHTVAPPPEGIQEHLWWLDLWQRIPPKRVTPASGIQESAGGA